MTHVEALAYLALTGWTVLVLATAWRTTQRAEAAVRALEERADG